MKYSKFLVFILLLPLFSFSIWHRYYISLTQVEFIEEQKSVQIITRVFLDDFENILKKRYDDTLVLTEGEEIPLTDTYIERYLKSNIKIKINGQDAKLIFIGREYADNLIKCYLEIKGVEHIESFELINKVLFDMYDDQQNMIKIKINTKQKSFLLFRQKDKAVLNFD